MKFRPHGILPAMITPLTDSGEVNLAELRKLIRFLLDGGVSGIFAIGTTGEFYALSRDEYRSILEVTMDEVAGRVPVYAGANDITTRGSLELAHIAQDVGVTALSVLTPMFISPNQNQVYDHYRVIAENVDIPILLYNNAPKTGVTITPATAARLADLPNIVGIKDSTGDLTNTAEYLRLTRGKDFHVMMGRDTLIYPALCCGAAGGVAACANVAPKLVMDIYNAFMRGDHQAALEAQFKVAPLRIAFSLGTFPAVIKAGLELQGIHVGPCFAPVGPLTAEEMDQLKKILKDLQLI